MPRRTRRNGRKRAVRRRRGPRKGRGRRGKRAMLTYSAPGKNPFPLKLRTKFTYSDTFNHTHDGGVRTSLFRGNSPWDPKFAIGGNSAAGFVQASQIYGKYRCFGSKIALTANIVQVDSGTVHAATKLVLVPSLSSIPITNAALTNNLPWSKYRYMSAIDRTGATLKAFHKVRTMNSVRVVDEDWYTDTNANPTPNFFWQIITANTAPTTTAYVVQITITITYYCEMSRPVEPRIFEVDPTYETAADAAEVIDHNEVDLVNAVEINLRV